MTNACQWSLPRSQTTASHGGRLRTSVENEAFGHHSASEPPDVIATVDDSRAPWLLRCHSRMSRCLGKRWREYLLFDLVFIDHYRRPLPARFRVVARRRLPGS